MSRAGKVNEVLPFKVKKLFVIGSQVFSRSFTARMHLLAVNEGACEVKASAASMASHPAESALSSAKQMNSTPKLGFSTPV